MHIGTKPRGVHLRLCSEDGDARKHVLNATQRHPELTVVDRLTTVYIGKHRIVLLVCYTPANKFVDLRDGIESTATRCPISGWLRPPPPSDPKLPGARRWRKECDAISTESTTQPRASICRP